MLEFLSGLDMELAKNNDSPLGGVSSSLAFDRFYFDNNRSSNEGDKQQHEEEEEEDEVMVEKAISNSFWL